MPVRALLYLDVSRMADLRTSESCTVSSGYTLRGGELSRNKTSGAVALLLCALGSLQCMGHCILDAVGRRTLSLLALKLACKSI